MSSDGSEGALLKANGELWHAANSFPVSLMPIAKPDRIGADGYEFEHADGGRYWFCRIVPLNPVKPRGYFLVAQDWSNIREDLRERMLAPIGAALIVVALIAVLIPVLVSRYVSAPIAGLARKVVRFSSEEQLASGGTEDEMQLIGEEFQRLDQQLTKAHADLLQRHRYEMELDRRLQRADRLATIGTLASGLAHEIGTPMGVIRARTELLLQEIPPAEKARESLQIVLGQIDRISKIVWMLLDYARRRESQRGRHDVRGIVEHVMKLVDAEAKRSRVRIIPDLGDQPLMAECDADQLQQVFVNLAVNAFDAMTTNGGTLRISAGIDHKDHGADRLRVSFEDSGPGVAPELRDQLFDPFFTTKPPGKGTGMGLAVGQSIMLEHGGDITYESVASGARFSVTLPLIGRSTEIKSTSRSHVVPGHEQ
jgi:signal transduction histidine kinase